MFQTFRFRSTADPTAVTNRSNAFESNALRKELSRYEKELGEREEKYRDLENQLNQLTSGDSALATAVKEIRELKEQKKIQDRHMEDLALYASNNEIILNEISDENEELRAKLGLDPRQKMPIEELREGQRRRDEGYRAENRELQKEVRFQRENFLFH